MRDGNTVHSMNIYELIGRSIALQRRIEDSLGVVGNKIDKMFDTLLDNTSDIINQDTIFKLSDAKESLFNSHVLAEEYIITINDFIINNIYKELTDNDIPIANVESIDTYKYKIMIPLDDNKDTRYGIALIVDFLKLDKTILIDDYDLGTSYTGDSINELNDSSANNYRSYVDKINKIIPKYLVS